MVKLFRYLKPYILQIILLLVSIGAQVWMGLQLPAMMAKIINEGIVKQDMNYIWTTGVWMIILAFLSAVCALFAGFLSARIGTGFARDIRMDFFKKVLSFSISEIDDFSTASLITRITNDISQVQQVTVMCLSMMLRAPMTCVLAIIQAIITAPNMTWIIALAVATILGLTVLVMAIAMPKFAIFQKLIDRITLLTREDLTGLRVIRAFNNEQVAKTKFERSNEKLSKLSIFIDIVMSLTNPLISLIFNGVMLVCIWIGITLMTENFAYLGNMMAFMQYAIQVVMSFLVLTMLFVMLPRANVSAKRINEVLGKKLKINWKDRTVGKPDLMPAVEFRHVDFAYDGAEAKVLQDVSFTAKAGETTAFIGSTGSGKSTLINLVPRFYEATSGEVLINGINVKEYAQDDLMKRIGYVPQKGRLFSGTVKSNILFGAPDGSDEVMKKAARVAQAEEFIEKMPDKYDSHIAQGGTNVSGGQRQRLSIARAIAKNPDIYIFDDSFSALDMKTDAKLRKALKPITQDAVTLIVTQRISTIKNAEQIVVLNQGKVVGKGNHEELLRDCQVYREIAKSQLSDDEFAKEMAKAEGKEA